MSKDAKIAEAEVKLTDFSNIYSLKGKVAVVTGGSRGLGLHAASGLLQAGCSKVYITSRKAAVCDAAVAALNALPNKAPGAVAISIPGDSSKYADIEALVAKVRETTDRVDILFANAGATWGAPFDKHPDDAFAKVMNLNVKAVFNTIKLFAPLMQRLTAAQADENTQPFADPARVIVTASVAGIGIGTTGEHGTYGYSASKAAVIHLAKNLAVELGPRGITVNSIAPGFFPSRMANGLMELTGGTEVIAQTSPDKRVGNADDIAGLVVFLASRAASHINGATVTVDGGAILGRSRL